MYKIHGPSRKCTFFDRRNEIVQLDCPWLLQAQKPILSLISIYFTKNAGGGEGGLHDGIRLQLPVMARLPHPPLPLPSRHPTPSLPSGPEVTAVQIPEPSCWASCCGLFPLPPPPQPPPAPATLVVKLPNQSYFREAAARSHRKAVTQGTGLMVSTAGLRAAAAGQQQQLPGRWVCVVFKPMR